MKPLDYLHLQMRLEGKGLVSPCLMEQVEIVPDEELPLILLAYLANGEWVAYYDEALSYDLQTELSAVRIEFPAVDPLLAVLKSHGLSFEVGYYKTYVFPVPPARAPEVLCLSKEDARVQSFGFDGFASEVYTIEREGVLVSACVSTRENEACGEAWVYTKPDYRKQGLAQKVVRAWAGSLLASGKVPFYSHKIENTASASLARKLGLQPVFEEIAIARI